MFNNGEFDIFAKSGFGQVFFGDTLIGPRLPSLTYLLAFNDQADLDASWARFVKDPAWAKLSHDPRYSYEEIVSNITNLILTPPPLLPVLTRSHHLFATSPRRHSVVIRTVMRDGLALALSALPSRKQP